MFTSSTSGVLVRITTASDNNRSSHSPSLSADGTRIAFTSDSDFLNQGLADNQFEVWLYDTIAMTYTRITTASDSARDSSSPSLSADGTRVAFLSNSDLLSQGLSAEQTAAWLYDTTTMTYTRLALVSDGSPYHPRSIGRPILSLNGTRIAFHSDSDFLGQNIPDDQFEIWLYDTTAMTLTRITTASHFLRSSVYPELNLDGTLVYFYSDSDFLGQGNPYGQFEVWLYNTATLTYTRITSSPGRDSAAPVSSADGTRVVFNSDVDFLNQNLHHFEVWLYDTVAMTYTRVTTSDFPRDSWSHFANLSPSGTKVAFVSDSDFVGQSAVEGDCHIWLYDIATLTYVLVPDTGYQGFGVDPISLNTDGSTLAFEDGIEIWLYQLLDMNARIYLPIVSK